MILSPYRNPPYRSPTPRDQGSPQTPKRKREEPHGLDNRPLQLETQILDDGISDTGANSPRTKVANRLKDLDIRSSQPTASTTNDDDPQRKRIKRRSGGYDSPLKAGSPTPVVEVSEKSKIARFGDPAFASSEVEETPDCRNKSQRSPSPPSPSPKHPIAYVEITPPKRVLTYQSSTSTESSKALSDAPPSPANFLGPPQQQDPEDSIDRTASPLPSKGDLTPDQAALTWQDHEITGHEIDPGGDDDGEGINGIGFRPTAAIAAARSQRRKQQVSEWRAREAKDARQKRFERRRVGGIGADLRSDGGGDGAAAMDLSSSSLARMVRFVGAG